MRIYPFWSRIVETDCRGKHVCTGTGAALRDFLDTLGDILSKDDFRLVKEDASAPLGKQLTLFEDGEHEEWRFVILPFDMKKQKENILRLLSESDHYSATWIFLEAPTEELPPEIEVLAILPPTLAQWEAVLAKYAPHFKGEVILPTNLEEASSFLKSLALAGEYSGFCQDKMEGTGWEKLQYIWEREPRLIALPISDLIHISYCLEVMHQKASFPQQVGNIIPAFFEEKMDLPVKMFLVKRGPDLIGNFLSALHKLDQDRANRALSEWIYTVRAVSSVFTAV